MAIDRRKLLAFGGLGAIGAGTGLNGPELRLGNPGLTIHIVRTDKGWEVAVPDFQEVIAPWQKPNDFVKWPTAIKLMPLDEFLKALDDLGRETA